MEDSAVLVSWEWTVRVLAEGRIVNRAAAEDHPVVVMDMSFTNQALCTAFIGNNTLRLAHKVHPVPSEIDHQIVRINLDAMKIPAEVQKRHNSGIFITHLSQCYLHLIRMIGNLLLQVVHLLVIGSARFVTDKKQNYWC